MSGCNSTKRWLWDSCFRRIQIYRPPLRFPEQDPIRGWPPGLEPSTQRHPVLLGQRLQCHTVCTLAHRCRRLPAASRPSSITAYQVPALPLWRRYPCIGLPAFRSRSLSGFPFALSQSLAFHDPPDGVAAEPEPPPDAERPGHLAPAVSGSASQFVRTKREGLKSPWGPVDSGWLKVSVHEPDGAEARVGGDQRHRLVMEQHTAAAMWRNGQDVLYLEPGEGAVRANLARRAVPPGPPTHPKSLLSSALTSALRAMVDGPEVVLASAPAAAVRDAAQAYLRPPADPPPRTSPGTPDRVPILSDRRRPAAQRVE